jgi:hypothetical protein
VADLIRTAVADFVEQNRQWLSWKHIKVLLAIPRCRTAALGGHLRHHLLQQLPKSTLPEVTNSENRIEPNRRRRRLRGCAEDALRFVRAEDNKVNPYFLRTVQDFCRRLSHGAPNLRR